MRTTKPLIASKNIYIYNSSQLYTFPPTKVAPSHFSTTPKHRPPKLSTDSQTDHRLKLVCLSWRGGFVPFSLSPLFVLLLLRVRRSMPFCFEPLQSFVASCKYWVFTLRFCCTPAGQIGDVNCAGGSWGGLALWKKSCILLNISMTKNCKLFTFHFCISYQFYPCNNNNVFCLFALALKTLIKPACFCGSFSSVPQKTQERTRCFALTNRLSCAKVFVWCGSRTSVPVDFGVMFWKIGGFLEVGLPKGLREALGEKCSCLTRKWLVCARITSIKFDFQSCVISNRSSIAYFAATLCRTTTVVPRITKMPVPPLPQKGNMATVSFWTNF